MARAQPFHKAGKIAALQYYIVQRTIAHSAWLRHANA
jgi:hypothetical protein